MVTIQDVAKKAGDIETVDAVVLPNHRTADVVQIQGPHDVQPGTAAGGFH